MSYKSLKVKLRVFSAGHIVAMAICYIKRMTATCLPMIGHLICYYYCIFQSAAVRKVLDTVASLLQRTFVCAKKTRWSVVYVECLDRKLGK